MVPRSLQEDSQIGIFCIQHMHRLSQMHSSYSIAKRCDSQSQRYAFSCEFERGQEGCNKMFTDFYMFKSLQLVAHLTESIKEK